MYNMYNHQQSSAINQLAHFAPQVFYNHQIVFEAQNKPISWSHLMQSPEIRVVPWVPERSQPVALWKPRGWSSYGFSAGIVGRTHWDEPVGSLPGLPFLVVHLSNVISPAGHRPMRELLPGPTGARPGSRNPLKDSDSTVAWRVSTQRSLHWGYPHSWMVYVTENTHQTCLQWKIPIKNGW